MLQRKRRGVYGRVKRMNFKDVDFRSSELMRLKVL